MWRTKKKEKTIQSEKSKNQKNNNEKYLRHTINCSEYVIVMCQHC